MMESAFRMTEGEVKYEHAEDCTLGSSGICRASLERRLVRRRPPARFKATISLIWRSSLRSIPRVMGQSCSSARRHYSADEHCEPDISASRQDSSSENAHPIFLRRNVRAPLSAREEAALSKRTEFYREFYRDGFFVVASNL